MKRFVPLIVFMALVGLFGFGIWWNTWHDARYVPSPLINKPAPDFALPKLDAPEQTVTKASLLGKPYLLNVFGSWCVACAEEHPVLMSDGRQLGIALVGYDYKDAPDDAKAWLRDNGSPYDLVIADQPGRTAIDFGVYGAPESFLVDAKGVIRYKHIGPLTPEVIAQELQPAIDAVKRETP